MSFLCWKKVYKWKRSTMTKTLFPEALFLLLRPEMLSHEDHLCCPFQILNGEKEKKKRESYSFFVLYFSFTKKLFCVILNREKTGSNQLKIMQWSLLFFLHTATFFFSFQAFVSSLSLLQIKANLKKKKISKQAKNVRHILLYNLRLGKGMVCLKNVDAGYFLEYGDMAGWEIPQLCNTALKIHTSSRTCLPFLYYFYLLLTF